MNLHDCSGFNATAEERSETMLESVAAKTTQFTWNDWVGQARSPMGDVNVLDLLLAALFLISGIVNLRRARSGFWPRPEYISLGRNPIEPEPMTPRMRRLTRFSGFAFLFVGVLGICVTVYHFVLP
jgi:hypothetical protein